MIIWAAKSNLELDSGLTVALLKLNKTSLNAISISVANLLLSTATTLGQPLFSTGPGTVTHLSFKSITPSKSASDEARLQDRKVEVKYVLDSEWNSIPKNDIPTKLIIKK